MLGAGFIDEDDGYYDASAGYGINASGAVVGSSSCTGGSDSDYAFLRTSGGTMVLLGRGPSHAYDINNSGLIVGTSIYTYSGGTVTKTAVGSFPGGSRGGCAFAVNNNERNDGLLPVREQSQPNACLPAPQRWNDDRPQFQRHRLRLWL